MNPFKSFGEDFPDKDQHPRAARGKRGRRLSALTPACFLVPVMFKQMSWLKHDRGFITESPFKILHILGESSQWLLLFVGDNANLESAVLTKHPSIHLTTMDQLLEY